MKRLNKEYKLNNINNSIALSYGSVDKSNPQVVFVSGRTWVTPQVEDEQTVDDVKSIIKSFKKGIRNKIIKSERFSINHICNFDFNYSVLKPNKQTFLTFCIYLRQKDDNVMNLLSLKPVMVDFISELSYDLSNNFKENYFNLSQSKL